MFGLNADGNEDIIVRSKQCDDFAYGATTGTTSFYIQGTTFTGLFDGVEMAAPTVLGTDGEGITEIIGVTYYSTNNKCGVIFVSDSGTTINTYSSTETPVEQTLNLAVSAGTFQDIFPVEQSEVENFVGVE